MRTVEKNKRPTMDLDAVKAALDAEAGAFTLFGGEVLLTPIEDLEELFRFGFERWGENTIQSNGTLINDAHVEMFKRYNVHVGISADGPMSLNSERWAGSDASTDIASRKTLGAIDRLLSEGVNTSLQLVLHRGNAAPNKILELKAWLLELHAKGLRSVNLHVLEVDNAGVAESLEMTDSENIIALGSLKELEAHGLAMTLFEDLRRALMRNPNDVPNCIWNACDPLTTRAVRGVDADGSRINCGRTNKDGVNWLKADEELPVRSIVLYNTPQEDGGCKDCRFFFACTGNCPGSAIDGDWRNRSQNCRMWYEMLAAAESELLTAGEMPASLDPVRMKELEDGLLGNVSRDRPHGDSHGDGWDHGDGHGDSNSRMKYLVQIPIGKP